MKTVHPSSEVYHLWAHQAQDHARNGQGNVSFTGLDAYSYRARIASLVPGEGTGAGRLAALVSSHKWSVTTSKHQSYVRRAIPHGMAVFIVPSLDPDHAVNLEHYAAHAEYLAAKASRARSHRVWLESQATDLQAEANKYCRFFGLADAFDPGMVQEARRRNKAAREAWEAQQERERLARAEQIRIDDAGKVEAWLRGDDDVSLSYSYPDTLLRLTGDGAEVETSRGARVPVSHARHAYRNLSRGLLASGARIGHYQVDQVDETTVTIGCHEIARVEVERFAGVMGWAVSQ